MNKFKRNPEKLKTLIKSLYSLPQRAETDKWKVLYDKELDNLYYVPPKLPHNTWLFDLNNEIALYVTPKNDVVGIFIEYFSSNFTEHQKEYKKALKLFKKGKGILEVDKRRKTDAKMFEGALITEVLKNSSNTMNA